MDVDIDAEIGYLVLMVMLFSTVIDDFLAVHVLFDILVLVSSTVCCSLVLFHLVGQELVDVVLQLDDLLAQMAQVLRLFC